MEAIDNGAPECMSAFPEQRQFGCPGAGLSSGKGPCRQKLRARTANYDTDKEGALTARQPESRR